MNISIDIQHRADVMFAELKGLRLFTGDVDSLELKDMADDMELKVRRVRTQAGVRRFKQPIGSIITNKGRKLHNISILDSVFEGWDLVKDKRGKKYDVGKDGGKWHAYGHNDWNDHIAEADSEDELYEVLDKKLAKNNPRSESQERFKNESDRRKLASRKYNEEWKAKSPKQVVEALSKKERADYDSLNAAGKKKYVNARRGFGTGPSEAMSHSYAMKLARLADKGEGMAKDKRAVDRKIDKLTKDLTPRQKTLLNHLPAKHRSEYLSLRESGQNHAQAFRTVNADVRAQNAKRKADRQAGAERAEVRTNLRTMTQRNEYKRLREKGATHEEALKQAKAYRGAPKTAPDVEKRQWSEDQEERRRSGEVRRSVSTRPSKNKAPNAKGGGAARQLPKSTQQAIKIANERYGANKPKAERTDAEIEAGLNRGFREQYDTLSGSQKRKYLQAFREGKTHSEAMAEARGGSGKAQGVLF